MRRAELEAVNQRHGVSATRFFTQEQFRRKYPFPSGLGLCSALVQVWWSYSKRQEDGLTAIVGATPTVLYDVRLRHICSFYFRIAPSESEITPIHKSWLQLKYGVTTLAELDALRSKYGAKSFLDLDLILQHEERIIDQTSFGSYSEKVIDALDVSGEPGLRLILLRYALPSRRSGESGHRFAVAVDHDQTCRLFDPNCGEITVRKSVDFSAWFSDFWTVSGYQQLTSASRFDMTSIYTYRFGKTPIEWDECS